MPLDNLYFKHDFGARNHPKLKGVKRKYGIEGLGIYWCLLEILYENNGSINEEELENICWDEKINFDKSIDIMHILKFDKDENNNWSFCKVNERIKKREEYCLKQKENANKRWEKYKEKKQAPIPDWFKEQQEQESFDENKKKRLDELKKLKDKDN